MNGAHDMGGMHGFGPVVAEPNEPVFHPSPREQESANFKPLLLSHFQAAIDT
jgi:hypothetical protein